MLEGDAPGPGSGILKQGALGFAAKARSFSVGVGSFEVRVQRTPGDLDEARDARLARIRNASMKAPSFGLEAQSSLLQFVNAWMASQSRRRGRHVH
jgi:hypothetical protein